MANTSVPTAQPVDTQVSCGGWCDEKASIQYTQCKNASYCSIVCQKADWRFHQHLCESFARYKERPAPNFRRIILLSEEYSVPTFMWHNVQLVGATGEMPPERDDGNVVFKAIAEGTGLRCSAGTVLTPDNFDVFSITAHQSNDKPKNLYNKCIDTLVGKELGHALRGSFVIVPKIKANQDLFVIDAEPNDFTIGLRQMIKQRKVGATSNASEGAGFTAVELGVEGLDVDRGILGHGVIKVTDVHGSL